MISGMDFIIGLLAFTTGLSAGWLLAQRKSSATKEELIALKAQAVEREKAAEHQGDFVQKALEAMNDKFENLANAALRANNKQFLENTDHKLQPLNAAHKELLQEVKDSEKRRAEDYGRLDEQLAAMQTGSAKMLESSEEMKNLLTGSSQARGNWGELLLERVVEFAGMQKHVNFKVQATLSDGSRPDMIILLPGEGAIPVDSKCPLTSFAKAKETTDPSQVTELMEEHAKAVKKHANDLISKDYSAFTTGKFDFTVMFMPGHHLLEAALQVDPKLQDYALERKLLITSPVTLVALLRTVRIYWQNDETNRSAEKIAALASNLFDRVKKVLEHYKDIGGSLTKAVNSYNAMYRSYESRLVPAGRDLQDASEELQRKKALDDDKEGPNKIDGLPELPLSDSSETTSE